MKVNILDAHDRYTHLMKQDFSIAECCQNLIDQKPFGDHPFYIFYHSRTEDDGFNKRGIWQPRLTKPSVQVNTMLFKAYPGTDILKIFWILPQPELWGQYIKGNVCESSEIQESIFKFINDKSSLESSEPEDPTDEEAQRLTFEYQPQLFKRDTLPDELKSIWDAKMSERERKRIQSIKPMSSEESSFVSL